MISLKANYFELFGLSVDYALNRRALKRSFLELQQTVHPDKFAGQDEAVVRQAAQQSAYINTAFETLDSDVSRAMYLLQLHNREYQPDDYRELDSELILRQMEWRETLEELAESVGSDVKLDELEDEVDAYLESLQNKFASLYSSSDWQGAAFIVTQLMFTQKMLDEIAVVR